MKDFSKKGEQLSAMFSHIKVIVSLWYIRQTLNHTKLLPSLLFLLYLHSIR